MKRLWIAILCVVLFCLTSCSGMTDGSQQKPNTTTETPTTERICTVRVTDHEGAPVRDVEVIVYENDDQLDRKAVDGAGRVDFLLRKGGEYRIGLVSTGETAYYYDESVTRTNDQQTEVTVVLYEIVSDAKEINAFGKGDEALVRTYTAYVIEEGTVYTPLAANDRNYYIFTPARPGIYRVSVANRQQVMLGYYGMPINPTRSPIAMAESDGFLILEVKETNVGESPDTTTRYVIGLEAGLETEGALLTVEHVGNPVKTPADEPWVDVLADRTLTPYEKPKGSLADLNIFDENLTVVFNEEDGYYHLNSVRGPLVLVRLTSDSPFLASFTTMCDTGRLGAYRYDDEGAFLRKESFNELIAQYAAICDAEYGVCPLDAKLAYMLQTVGEAKQWWDFDSGNHLFVGEEVLPPADTAWLFACCYVKR